MSRLEDRLAALAAMSPAQLRGAWLEIFKLAAPGISPSLLALGVAHRLQEKALGGLGGTHARELARLSKRFAATGEIGIDAAATLKTGTRLVREWQGIQHHVEIRDDGYIYRDKHYRSLSQIARMITGAHWSGQQFLDCPVRPVRRAGGDGPLP